MNPQLLSLAEWRALLRHNDERERRRGEFLLGTIVDLLQVAEECKKGQEAFDGAAFRAGWEALGEKGVRAGVEDHGQDRMELDAGERAVLLPVLLDPRMGHAASADADALIDPLCADGRARGIGG
jgi:hypothetical protein